MSSYKIEVELAGQDNLSPSIRQSMQSLEGLESAAERAEAALDMSGAERGMAVTINSVDDLQSALSRLSSTEGAGQLDGQLREVGAAAQSSVDDVAALENQLAQVGQGSVTADAGVDQLGAELQQLGQQAQGAQSGLTGAATSADRIGDEAKESAGQVEQLGRKMQDTGRNAQQMGTGGRFFGGLSNEIQGVVAAYGLLKSAEMVTDTIDAGRAVNLTTEAFADYTDELGGSANALNDLRSETRLTINDQVLMATTSQLLGLKIAGTTEQAAEMIGMVSQLSRLNPGQSLAEGMGSFLQVMKNGSASIEMLDNIGISAARVKAILAEAGKPISDQAAFADAVVQAGKERIVEMQDFLTSTTVAGEEAISRWQTRVQNAVGDIQGRVGQAVTGIAGLLEIGLGMNPSQVAATEAARKLAENQANAYGDTLSALLTERVNEAYDGALLGIEPDFGAIATLFSSKMASFQQLGIEADPVVVLNDTLKDLGLTLQVDEASMQMLLSAYGQLTTVGTDGVDGITRSLQIQRQEAFEANALIERQGASLKQAGADAVEYQQALDDLLNQGLALSDVEVSFKLNQESIVSDFTTAMEEAKALGIEVDPSTILSASFGRYGLVAKDAQVAFDAILYGYAQVTAQTPGAAAGVDAVTLSIQQQTNALLDSAAKQRSAYYMSSIGQMDDREGSGLTWQVTQGIREGRDALEAFYAYAESAYTDFNDHTVQGLDEAFAAVQLRGEQGFISDEDVSKAQAIHDRFAEVAQMNLGQLLGQSSGGAQGEIYDKVLAGLPEAMQGEAQKLFDLASGRANDLSNVMEDNVIPMLQALYAVDPNMATQAVANLTQLLQNASAMGLGPGATASIINGQFMPMYGGYGGVGGGYGGGSGQTFTVNPGDTPSEIAAKLGVSVDEVLKATGAKKANLMPTGTFTLAGNGGGYGGMTYGSADWGQTLHESYQPDTFDETLRLAAGYTADMASDFVAINDSSAAWIDSVSGFLGSSHDMEINITAKGDPWLIEAMKNGGVVVNTTGNGGGSGKGTSTAYPQRGGKNSTAVAIPD